LAIGCISGIDDSKGSTPRAAETVITEMKEPIRKKAKVSISGVSFIVLINSRVDAESVKSFTLDDCYAVTVDIVCNSLAIACPLIALEWCKHCAYVFRVASEKLLLNG
jgi:hypothetical protein